MYHLSLTSHLERRASMGRPQLSEVDGKTLDSTVTTPEPSAFYSETSLLESCTSTLASLSRPESQLSSSLVSDQLVSDVAPVQAGSHSVMQFWAMETCRDLLKQGLLCIRSSAGYEQAMRIWWDAFRIAREHRFHGMLGVLITNMGAIYRRQGHKMEGRRVLESGWTMTTSIFKMTEETERWMYQLGVNYANSLFEDSMYRESLQVRQRSLGMLDRLEQTQGAKRMDLTADRVRLLTDIGTGVHATGDFRGAQSYHGLALNLFDHGVVGRSLQFTVLMNMALTLRTRGHFKQAFEYYTLAKSLVARAGDAYAALCQQVECKLQVTRLEAQSAEEVYCLARLQSSLLNDKDQALNTLNDEWIHGDAPLLPSDLRLALTTDEAFELWHAKPQDQEEVLMRHLRILLETPHRNRRHIGRVYGNLGSLYAEQGHLQRSGAFHETQLDLCRDDQDRLGECIALYHLGRLVFLRSEELEPTDLREGLNLLERSYQLAYDLGHDLIQAKTLLALVSIASASASYVRRIQVLPSFKHRSMFRLPSPGPSLSLSEFREAWRQHDAVKMDACARSWASESMQLMQTCLE